MSRKTYEPCAKLDIVFTKADLTVIVDDFDVETAKTKLIKLASQIAQRGFVVSILAKPRRFNGKDGE